MMSQPGYQIIIIHVFPNISQSKSNQTLKFGHVIEHNQGNFFFFKNYAENEAGGQVPDVFLFFRKALYEIKSSAL